ASLSDPPPEVAPAAPPVAGLAAARPRAAVFARVPDLAAVLPADLAARLQLGHPLGQGLLLGARRLGQGAGHLVVLAGDQVHVGQDALELPAELRLGLVPHAGGHAQRAAGQPGQVVDHFALGLHRPAHSRAVAALRGPASLCAKGAPAGSGDQERKALQGGPMILVTGGAGFIGSNLVGALAARGERVVVADWLGRPSDGHEKWRNLAKAELEAIVPPEELLAALELGEFTPDAVFHMGAVSATTETDGDLLAQTNITLSQRLWRWCCETRVPFIYASSA
ncbi:hldD, partial [Symbiodinium necroappetens]